MRGIDLLHKGTQPVPLVLPPANRKVIPGKDLGNQTVDRMALLHHGDEFLSRFVVQEGRSFLCEDFLVSSAVIIPRRHG